MMRSMTVLWTLLAILVGVGLFLLKYEVAAQEEHLAGINRQILENQEAIHVLKAEWSYLNDPDRLRDLGEKHLGMKVVQPTQIVAIASLPMAEPRVDEPVTVLAEGAKPAEPEKKATAAPVAPAPAAQAVAAKAPAAPVTVAKPAAPVQKPVAVAANKPAAQPVAKPTQPALAPIPVSAAPVSAPAPAPRPAPVAVAPRPQSVAPPVTPVYDSAATVPAESFTKPRGTVMVIKSPALIEAEMGATRR